MHIERRQLATARAGVVLRAAADGGQRFVGHAAVFDVRAAIGDPLNYGFYESISRGAFARTLTTSDVRMLVDHDPAKVVARSTAGTLGLSEDHVGLAVDAALDTRLSYVSDLAVNLSLRNISGMSFGFRVTGDDWTTEEIRGADGQPARVDVRTIREVDLIEVSAVTWPAYESTDAHLAA